MARLTPWALALFALPVAAETVTPDPKAPTFLQTLFQVEQAPLVKVFRREAGSDPVILVGPRGDKLYESRHPDAVRWYSNTSLDIVSIEDPELGPWQALGKVEAILDYQGIAFAEPAWPSPRYAGEEVRLCQPYQEAAHALTPEEVQHLVVARTWLTSAHLGQDDNFGFSSSAKVSLQPDGSLYCARFSLPDLAGHYRWHLENKAGFDKQAFSHDLELKKVPFEVTLPPPADVLSPHLYQLHLLADDILAGSVRARLVLHLGDNQTTTRILRLDEKGLGELRYPQEPGQNVTVTGSIGFEDSSGQTRQLKLAPRTLVAMPPKPVAAPKPEVVAEAKSSISGLWWLLALLPVLFGSIWWLLRRRNGEKAVSESVLEMPETQPQAPENDGFLLDLSRPDDFNEKI